MAPKLVNKGFSSWSQFGVLLGMIGVGLVAASIAGAGTWKIMTGQGFLNMQQDMLNPKYADAIKAIQLVSTLFIFFVPAVAYAFICYRNGWLALGFRPAFSWNTALICLVIIIVSLPFIDWLTSVNKAIYLPASSKKYFDDLEKAYEDQVKVIGDVRTNGQYLVSLTMIALIPAFFEEVLFRGALQNLLSRWKYNGYVYLFVVAVLIMAAKAIWLKPVNPWFFYGGVIVAVLLVLRSHVAMQKLNNLVNKPLAAVLLTAVLFSLVHASWYGFIPRFALGVVLGLIFHYTRNIMYGIVIHFFNNAAVVTIMFLAARQHKPIEDTPSQGFSWWIAIISAAALVFLFRLLSRQQNLAMPEEVTDLRNNPFEKPIQENDPAA